MFNQRQSRRCSKQSVPIEILLFLYFLLLLFSGNFFVLVNFAKYILVANIIIIFL